MHAPISLPEAEQAAPPPSNRPSNQPSNQPSNRRARFWIGFAAGFALLTIASCSGVGIALGLNELSLAELQGNGVVWTPPPYTPAATPLPVADAAAVVGGSTRFAAGERARNLTNSRVNLRSTPGYLSKAASDVIGALQPGDRVTILGENQVADNLVWWRVRAALADGRTVDGWVAEATASGVQILGE